MNWPAPIYSDFDHDERDVGLQRAPHGARRADARRVRRAATPSRSTVSDRLRRFNGLGLDAALSPAAARADRLTPGEYGPYVLSVARLEGNKRVDLIVRGHGARARAAHARRRRRRQPPPPHRAGGRGGRGDAIASRFRGSGRRRRPGRRSTATRWPLVYVPFDEDYGHATLEAFLAAQAGRHGRRLRAARSSSCEDDVNGLVCEPTPRSHGARAVAAGRRSAAAPAALGRRRPRRGPRHHLGRGDRDGW